MLLILLFLGQEEILIHCSGFWSIIIKLLLTCIKVINLYKDCSFPEPVYFLVTVLFLSLPLFVLSFGVLIMVLNGLKSPDEIT